jgi:hypothetical protein
MMFGPGAWMRHYTSKGFWQPLSRLSYRPGLWNKRLGASEPAFRVLVVTSASAVML